MADTEKKYNVDTMAMIEAFCEYRVGKTNLKSASKELEASTGLPKETCEALLKEMKRHNVTQIRGYTNEPERLKKGKKGKPNDAKLKLVLIECLVYRSCIQFTQGVGYVCKKISYCCHL